ncbi:hypothetical protein [Vallitalea sp.]|jgi:hypothetical protein|uniref:hypothetical protein n=1 Tax=Vallitalea sp. TaxID=1882829 RepID=UPI0025FD2A6E|nr:hypothetical protein [Vallitalea sp.]MCT4685899.1 hypothetical protein [Vallitalea sp.]
MDKIINSLQEEIIKNNIFEFRMSKLNEDGTLIIIGCFDLSYHHSIEISIKETTYISCPITFSNAKFRLATEAEKKYLKSTSISEWNELIICIILDEDIDETPTKHFIFAEELHYKVGNVYHYVRENLQEGERIAEWVK